MAKGVASGYAAISCTVTTEEVFNFILDLLDIQNNIVRHFSSCARRFASLVTA